MSTKAGNFFKDRKTQDAVIRNLEVIGQAVKDIGVDDLSKSCPDVPWAQVAGARNVLAHHYLGVDIQLVWNIVEIHDGVAMKKARKRARG